jgi:hypothetical protein
MGINPDPRDLPDGAKRRRVFLRLIAIVLAATLAVVATNRIGDEALAVLAGAVCGVAATIPTSLIILAVLRQREAGNDRYEEPYPHPPAHGQYPPIVVVAPPDRWQQPTGWNGLPASLPPPTQRDFTVVGGTPNEQDSTDDY